MTRPFKHRRAEGPRAEPGERDHFRAASCQWEPTAALWRPEDCRAIYLIFHNARRTGQFFVEYLGVEQQPETA